MTPKERMKPEEQKTIVRRCVIGITRCAIVALICASTACSTTRVTRSDRQEAAIADSPAGVESAIRRGWAAFRNKNKAEYAADDATEVWTDGKGTHDKAAVLREMDNVNLKNYSLSDFKVTQLGPDATLVTYRAKVEGTNGERSFNSDMDVTEVRVKRGGHWQELRYQESERAAQPAVSPSPRQ